MISEKPVFVHKCRWTLESTNLPAILMHKASFDFIGKIIYFSYYEMQNNCPLTKWLSDLGNKKMTFTTYDGAGKPIYKIIFSGISLLSDKIFFDYQSTDISSRDISINYTSLERTDFSEETNANTIQS